MSNPTDPDRPLILVLGATGQQGGAVARRLLGKGFRVRALTRDPDKPAARTLASRGAEVVQGDLDHPASLARALEGADGVFSVQNFMEAGYEGEVRHGATLVDAAKNAGVNHFVQSSVGSADRRTGIPHFDSKFEVEQYVRASGLPFTILRPVFFMDNWTWMGGSIREGTLAQPLRPETSLQQIAVDDIGAFAAIAFENPDAWLGRAVDLAGDELTMTEIAETFARVLGRPVRYVHVPWEGFEAQAGEEMTTMFRWFDEVGYAADIAALRREHPALQTLEQHLRAEGWSTQPTGQAGDTSAGFTEQELIQ